MSARSIPWHRRPEVLANRASQSVETVELDESLSEYVHHAVCSAYRHPSAVTRLVGVLYALSEGKARLEADYGEVGFLGRGDEKGEPNEDSDKQWCQRAKKRLEAHEDPLVRVARKGGRRDGVYWPTEWDLTVYLAAREDVIERALATGRWARAPREAVDEAVREHLEKRRKDRGEKPPLAGRNHISRPENLVKQAVGLLLSIRKAAEGLNLDAGQYLAEVVRAGLDALEAVADEDAEVRAGREALGGLLERIAVKKAPPLGVNLTPSETADDGAFEAPSEEQKNRALKVVPSPVDPALDEVAADPYLVIDPRAVPRPVPRSVTAQEPRETEQDRFERVRRLTLAKKVGAEYIAHCPAHDDSSASLNLRMKGGKFVMICRSQACAFEDIMATIDSGAFVARSPKLKSSTKKGTHQAEDRTVVACYTYTDELGEPLYRVVRYEPKTFRQERYEGGRWIGVMGDVRRVPYRLDALLAADPSEPVYIVEGEKAVEALEAVGLLATTNAGGAGKWLSEFSDYLRGRVVVVLPDNDHVGRDHADLVVKSLRGIARAVSIVELDGLEAKGDVVDWLANGHNADELRESTYVPSEPMRPRLALVTPEYVAPAEVTLEPIVPRCFDCGATATERCVCDGPLPWDREGF